ncbi:hypothetical protein KC367_g1628 [Hortaea werneckii]|nr:hypothetical protein KC315_g855 [Hortaea werneckii]KAI7483272.1 hypothetical protein KC357_g3428 [Hortaea werneckii]KAI7503501.1 hypothetical protein KC367_g1628 [Hortaea werneckii]
MAENNSKSFLGTEKTGKEEERMVERALVPEGEKQGAAVDQGIVSLQAAVRAEKSGSTPVPQLENVAALWESTQSAIRKAADAANQAREANERAGKAESEAEKAKAEAAKMKSDAERMKSAAEQMQKSASDALRMLDEKMELVRKLGADIESLWSTSEAVKQRHSAEMDAWRAGLAAETEAWKDHMKADLAAENIAWRETMKAEVKAEAEKMAEEATLKKVEELKKDYDFQLKGLGVELSLSEDATDELAEKQGSLAEKAEELAERVDEIELVVGLRTTATQGPGRGNRGRGRP